MYSCLLNKKVWRTPGSIFEFDKARRDFLDLLLSLDSGRFNFITKKAAGLRNGIKCQVDRSLTSSGSYNVAFPIKFDDGVYWLLRVRRPSNQSASTEDQLMKSSIATMMYLKDNKRIPIPEVYFSCSSWDNPLHAPFIVMELIDGIPISYADVRDPKKPWLQDEICDQICRIANEFSNLRFEKIGALFPTKDLDIYDVKATFDWRGSRYYPKDSHYDGFKNAKEYYTALANRSWDRARQGFPSVLPLLESWRWETTNDQYKRLFTAYLYLECLALVQWDKVHDEFCLQHQDFYFQNFLIDQNDKVVALIDLDWASTVPLHGYDPLSFCESWTKKFEEKSFEYLSKWEWLDGSHMPLVSEIYKSPEGTLCRLLGTSLRPDPPRFAPKLFEACYSMAWTNSELQRRQCMIEALEKVEKQIRES